MRININKKLRDYRALEREVGAMAFCELGYGIPKLRQFLRKHDLDMPISDTHYKTVCTGFARAAWRRM
jgi:hypothetical protein